MKERIQQKAGELFRRYGIRSVTMDEIASQLGISKKTIYQFYADKDALVKDIFKSITDHNKEKCIEIRSNSENAIHEQYLASDSAQEIFNNMNTSLLFDLNRFHPNVFADFEKFKKQFLFNIIKENIVRGIKEGLFRKDIDVNIITWLKLEMISGVLHNEEVVTGKTKPYQFENEMKDFFLHGLCTEKGLSFISKYKQQRQKRSA
ncbi:MAG: TetR/AcrR family transcriptional regulator [Parafilimonas sp.]|nr:TetR/AcrR family transcriptional regulator [Parafilimonas sp.]